MTVKLPIKEFKIVLENGIEIISKNPGSSEDIFTPSKDIYSHSHFLVSKDNKNIGDVVGFQLNMRYDEKDKPACVELDVNTDLFKQTGGLFSPP